MGVFAKYIVSSRAKVSTVVASSTCIQSSNSYTIAIMSSNGSGTKK